jgi:hypothetical protein
MLAVEAPVNGVLQDETSWSIPIMSELRSRYMAFLLRLWQVKNEEGLAWRASLESARTGERHGFASLDELFDVLNKWIEEGEVMTNEVAGSGQRCAPNSEIRRKEKRR